MNRTRRPFWRRALPWLGVVVGAGVVALLVLVVLVKITDRPAKVPTGFTPPTSVPRSTALPTDRLLFDSDRTGHFEIYVMRADGSGVKALTKDRRFDSWWPRLSPDRRTVVFYRSPAGKHDLDFSVTSLWAMAVDGSRLTQLRPPGLDGWTFQGHAEWSPDGRRLTMFGGSRINPQIFVTNSLGQKPRQITDRPGTNIDPSWAPDGKHLVFVGCPRSICTEADYEIYRIPVAGGQAERVTRNDVPDYDPYYSPDGRQLGWLQKLGGKGIGVWDVRLAGADGQSARRLAGDAGVTSRPQWSADGTKIYMHRIAPGGAKFDIYVTDASGDGPLRMVTKGQPGNNEYPSP